MNLYIYIYELKYILIHETRSLIYIYIYSYNYFKFQNNHFILWIRTCFEFMVWFNGLFSYHHGTCFLGVSTPSQLEFVIYDILALFTQMGVYSLGSAYSLRGVPRKNSQRPRRLMPAMHCLRVWRWAEGNLEVGAQQPMTLTIHLVRRFQRNCPLKIRGNRFWFWFNADRPSRLSLPTSRQA